MSLTPHQIHRIDQQKAAVSEQLDRLVEQAREHLATGDCRDGDCPGMAAIVEITTNPAKHNQALLLQAITRRAKEGPRP